MKTKKLILTIVCLLVLSSLSYAQDSLECILKIECPFQGYPSHNIVGGGDINGDGYDEIMLSPCESSGYGAVYIYLGDTELDTIPDFTIYGEEPNSYFGHSVSFAGDLNGDGYDDLVIGAPEYGPPEWGGRVYICIGSEDFDTEPDYILDGYEYAGTGDPWYLEFGTVVNTKGDFNSDGYNDLVVTSWGPSLFYFGQIDIFYGGVSIDTVVDVHIQGQMQGDYGFTASVGDINGDGYDDLTSGNGFHPNIEKVRIFLGGENMDPFPDATITGEGDQFGRYIAMDGDINNDSCNDLLISQSDPDQVNIYLGNQNLNLSCDYVLNYNNNIPNLFFANINNDQFSDIVVSKPTDHKIYIYSGSNIFDTIPDFVIEDTTCNGLGTFGYNLDDINNDNHNEILVSKFINSVWGAYIYTLSGDSTGIDNHLHNEDFMLSNYPNPFSNLTTIYFNLLQRGKDTKIKVYNIKGQLVKELKMQKAKGKIEWDCTDNDGKEVPNGVYLYKLYDGNKTFDINKMIKIN